MSSLPFHPLIPNLQALGLKKNGDPIWPVMGGSEDGGDQGGQQEQQNGSQQTGQGGNTDMGFPQNTPVAQMTDAQRTAYYSFLGFPEKTPVANMTPEQQAAYYRHQNRQSDNKLQAFHGFTPEDVNNMWTRLNELESERLTEGQRAIKDAADQAAADARAAVEAELRPKLLASQLKAVASPAFQGDDNKLNAWLDGVDPAKFVGENGDIDAAKVTSHLTAIVGPPTSANQHRQWGQHSGPPPATPPGQNGKAEAERRKERRVYT